MYMLSCEAAALPTFYLFINNDAIMAQMNEVEKNFLQELMETKRIKITN